MRKLCAHEYTQNTLLLNKKQCSVCGAVGDSHLPLPPTLIDAYPEMKSSTTEQYAADAQLQRDIEAARGVKPEIGNADGYEKYMSAIAEREKKLSALARQEGGAHYKDRAIQPVEYIHANGLGFIEGSIVKYITRWRDKGGKGDLEKIKHYVDLLIELEGKREINPAPAVYDGWVEWHGGENPVPGKTVEVKYSKANPPAQPHRSEMFRWRHAYEDDSTAFPSFNIIAYRVV